MKNLMTTALAIILLTWLLAPGCITPENGPARRSAHPFDSPSWWGSDPTCSPGCPPSLPAGGF
jgi:hypothetical protein